MPDIVADAAQGRIQEVIAGTVSPGREAHSNPVVVGTIHIGSGGVIHRICFFDGVVTRCYIAKAVGTIRCRGRRCHDGAIAVPQNNSYPTDAAVRVSRITIRICIQTNLTTDASLIRLIAVHAGIAITTGGYRNRRWIRTRRLGVVGGEIRVGLIYVGGRRSGRYIRTVVTAGIRADRLGRTRAVGDHYIHVGQVGFTRILSAIAIGIDKQMTAHRARVGLITVIPCIHRSTGRHTDITWICPGGLRVIGRKIRIRLVHIDRRRSRSHTRCCVIAIGITTDGLHVAQRISDHHIHVGQIWLTRILGAIAIGIDEQVTRYCTGVGLIAVHAGIAVTTGGYRNCRWIRTRRLGVVGGEIRIGFIHVGGRRSGRYVRTVVAAGICADRLGRTRAVGDHYIHVGQVGFTCILGAVTVGIDKQMTAHRARIGLIAVIACICCRIYDNSNRAGITAGRCGRVVICREVRIGFIDIDSGSTTNDINSNPVAISIGGNGMVYALAVGDIHIHIGQIRLSCILGAIAIGIDEQMTVNISPVGIQEIIAAGHTRTVQGDGNAVVIAAIAVLSRNMIRRIGFDNRVISDRQPCETVAAIGCRCRGANDIVGAVPQLDGHPGDAAIGIIQITILIHIQAHLSTDGSQQLDLIVLHFTGEGLFVVPDAVFVENIVGGSVTTVDAVAETRIGVSGIARRRHRHIQRNRGSGCSSHISSNLLSRIVEISVAVEIDPGVEKAGASSHIGSRQDIDSDGITDSEDMALQAGTTDGNAIVIITRVIVGIVVITQGIADGSLRHDVVIVIDICTQESQVISIGKHRQTVRRITITGRRVPIVGTGASIAAQGLGIGGTTESRCLHHVSVGWIDSEDAATFTTGSLVFFEIQQAVCRKSQPLSVHGQLGLGDKCRCACSHIDGIDIDIAVISSGRIAIIGTIELSGAIVGPGVISETGDGHPGHSYGRTDRRPVISRSCRIIIGAIRIKSANLVAVAS